MKQLAAFVLLFGALSLVGCGPTSVADLPNPPTTTQKVARQTETPDFSNSNLLQLQGNTTSTIALVGKAILQGTVRSPKGAVDQATVVIEYFPRSIYSSQQKLARTDNEGKWKSEKLPGGRYRIRAFRSPDIGMTTGQVLFLGNDEVKNVDISTDEYSSVTVSTSTSNTAPVVGQTVQLRVKVDQRGVDVQGRVGSVGINNIDVNLLVSSPMALVSSANTKTNANGEAFWSARCNAIGSVTATYTVPGSPPKIEQYQCGARPTTTTQSNSTTTGVSN